MSEPTHEHWTSRGPTLTASTAAERLRYARDRLVQAQDWHDTARADVTEAARAVTEQQTAYDQAVHDLLSEVMGGELGAVTDAELRGVQPQSMSVLQPPPGGFAKGGVIPPRPEGYSFPPTPGEWIATPVVTYTDLLDAEQKGYDAGYAEALSDHLELPKPDGEQP